MFIFYHTGPKHRETIEKSQSLSIGSTHKVNSENLKVPGPHRKFIQGLRLQVQGTHGDIHPISKSFSTEPSPQTEKFIQTQKFPVQDLHTG